MIGNVVPTIVAAIAPERYNTIWRVSLGIGVVPPLMLLYLRIKLKEPESFSRNSFRGTKTPYKLAFKYYGFRLLIVAAIWFIYDFSAYAFSIYSTTITSNLVADDAPQYLSLAWGILINFFYLLCHLQSLSQSILLFLHYFLLYRLIYFYSFLLGSGAFFWPN